MKNRVARKTYERLISQLRQLQHELVTVIIPDITLAREHSNNEENDQLIHAKQHQQNFETRIINLKKLIDNTDVVTRVKFTGTASYGMLVKMENDESGEVKVFRIVGEMESTEQNDVSIKSPVGVAIIGSQVGDNVEIKKPSGSQSWTVLDISVDPLFES